MSTTGVGGLTLGGGIGYLTRGYGLSIDNLLSADLVTADGRPVRASKAENDDLFWAIRGGGGNFGVATSFEFQLHPVDTVTVGLFFYELDYAGDLFRFWREWIKDAPETYGAFPAFQIAPPLPFVPGRPARRHIRHRGGAVHRADRGGRRGDGPVPRPRAACRRDGRPDALPVAQRRVRRDLPEGHPQLLEGQLRHRTDRRGHRGAPAHGPNVPEVSATMHLYSINGAAHRVAADETAFAYRHATFAPVYIAAWQDSADDEARIKWVRDYYQATAPHSEPGGYINFMQDDDQGRIQDNYLGNYARLVDIKRKYDPDNLFHGNQNIKP